MHYVQPIKKGRHSRRSSILIFQFNSIMLYRLEKKKKEGPSRELGLMVWVVVGEADSAALQAFLAPGVLLIKF